MDKNESFIMTVDKEKMQVDRSTPAGKAFDAYQKEADALAGTPMGDFMNKVLAYTEASAVIAQTMTPEEAGKAVSQLRRKFESDLK